jgi:transcriptional regulator of acetoin/glycerol metabolism
MKNVIERVLLLADGESLRLEDLPPEIRGAFGQTGRSFILPAAGVDLEELERDLVIQALDRADGNKTGAARLLGLSRDTLRYRLEKYGVH